MKIYEVKNQNYTAEQRAAQKPPQTISRAPAETKKPRSKKRIFGWSFMIIILLAVGVYFFVDAALSSTTTVFSNHQGFSIANLLGALFKFNNSTDVALKGEDLDRTNFMIYGLTLDENRTDTMMLASYYWKEHKLVTLNIPRDLYTTYQGYQGKIVSLYAVGKALQPKDRSYPPQYVSDFISKEYNIPIDYWVVINMKAFVQLVDSLGGVTVDVARSFTDCLYPNADYTGYIRPCPHFDAGVQTMDGATALIYARSRHSTDFLEGTDFARSQRQEQVIGAVLTKFKDQGILTNVSQLNNYLQIFSNNVYTSLSPDEVLQLAKVADGLNPSSDYKSINWGFSSGFICGATTPDGADVLYYGIPGDCQAPTGVDSPSPYRKMALDVVQNLLQSAESQTSTPASISTTTPPASQ